MSFCNQCCGGEHGIQREAQITQRYGKKMEGFILVLDMNLRFLWYMQAELLSRQWDTWFMNEI